MRRRFFIWMVLMGASLGAQDLDLPDLSNYQHNWMIYNPAFTGSREVSSISTFYRQVDFEIPAPVYGQLSWHSPTKNEKVAIGLSYFNETNPGSLFNTSGASSSQTKDNLYLNYAFRIWTGGGRLAFGISAGVTAYTMSFHPNVLHPGDAYLMREGFEVIPNIGAGVMYYTERYFVGVSIPKFLSRGDRLQEISHDFRSYSGVFTGGLDLRTSDNFTINPSTLILYKLNQPLNVQAGLNFGLFDEKVWFGGVYKRPDFLSALFNIELSPKIMLGYSFSFSLGNTSNYYDKTHEIVFRYEFRRTVPSNIPFYY
ncbi:MAG: PorP/SprF family type IX secretion system membrane protein [Bacteroidales bacterium]|nr:PorP/SprF family type IX secretion system membrane protein [Bacteroidales bacterium]